MASVRTEYKKTHAASVREDSKGRETGVIKETGRENRMKKLNVENPFFEFMGRIGDVMAVNVLFLVFSIPVVTIGASYTALYQTLREIQEGKTVWKSFWAAWRGALKHSIPVWIFLLVCGAILVFDILFLGRFDGSGFWKIVGVVTWAFLLLWSMVFCYLFPVVLQEGGRGKEMLGKSLFLAVQNLPCTMPMVVLNSIPAICIVLGGFFMGIAVPIYMVAGFGATAYLNLFLLERCRK